MCLDTSAYSAFKRGHQGITDALQRAEDIVLNSIVLGELHAGFRAGGRPDENRRQLEDFLRSTRVRTVGVNDETALRYSEIIAYLRKQGTPIPTNDVWIAASAMQFGLVLLTTDPHFDRVAQVSVERHPS